MSIVVEQSSTSIIDLMEVSDDDEVMLEPKKKRKLSTFTVNFFDSIYCLQFVKIFHYFHRQTAIPLI